MKLNWWQREGTKRALGTKKGEAAIAFLESADGEEMLTAMVKVVQAVAKKDWEGAWKALPPEVRAYAESHLGGAGLPR